MTKSESEPVGYGRPPTRSRFKPGHSGNPRGRPKRRSIKADLRDALSETTGSDGSTKQQQMVKKLVDEAAGGDLGSMKLLFALTATFLRDDSDDDDEQIGPEHQTLIDEFQARQAIANNSSPDQEDSND
jgi:hypothetical protein